ncbi:hypothetical protein WR25_05566 [Diploscapter pachys]|uniref:Protein kinase domain-containing protein n=1 Tax=Diploscapter pachys TaxID=2018661 RepID=A0A2A2LT38_9BILA|nr:hypothetical protein WR25_05566 [Diploscapter pachys]
MDRRSFDSADSADAENHNPTEDWYKKCGPHCFCHPSLAMTHPLSVPPYGICPPYNPSDFHSPHPYVGGCPNQRSPSAHPIDILDRPSTRPTVPLPSGYVDFNNVMCEQQYGQMQQMELRRSEAGIDMKAQMQMYGNSEHDNERSRDGDKDTVLHVKKRAITAKESSSEEANQDDQPNRKIEKRPLPNSQNVPNATVTRRSRYSTPSPVSTLSDVPLSISLPSAPSVKLPSAGSRYASPFEPVQSTVNSLYPSPTPVPPQPNASDTPSQDQKMDNRALAKMFKDKGIDLANSRKLGSGRYSKVVTALDANGEQIAIKIINTNKVTKEFKDKFLPREIDLWKNLVHDSLIRVLGHYTSANHVFLSMECGETDVLHYVQAHGPVPENKARVWMHQIVSGVNYMHRKGVAHRDLKLENLILCKDRVKIGDFGFCTNMIPGQLSNTFCGSKSYSSPEVLLGIPYDPFKADVWSVGVIAFIIVTDQMPFIEAQPNAMIVKSQKECAYRFPSHLYLSEECISSIHFMMTYSPRDRSFDGRYKLRRVSISDLNKLKFTDDGTTQLKKTKLKLDDRKYSVTQGSIPNKSLVFMAESFQADRSKGQPIKPATQVDGTITITPYLASTAEKESVDLPEELPIRPIRREAEADFDSLKQRHLPYGIPSKKRKRRDRESGQVKMEHLVIKQESQSHSEAEAEDSTRSPSAKRHK